ncbi:MAG: TonB-dependent receptor, partial [Bacteroidota bacterium]|nr:TonB-dependent receptor [Bacteroidota bacterium]
NFYSEENYANNLSKMDYSSGLRDFTLKHDLDFFPNPDHSIKMGIITTLHKFTPSALLVSDDNQEEEPMRFVDEVEVLESAIYIEDDFRIASNFKVNGGMRLSHYLNDEGNSIINSEPRVALSFKLNRNASFKSSYTVMNQYNHLLSNTGIGLPTDLWVPSTNKVAPQKSQQIAIGIAKDISQHDLALTIEGYYKKSDRIIAYKEGASFLNINTNRTDGKIINWEDNVTSGQSWSYGIEFLLEKHIGRLAGWAGYTLSWSLVQFDSINNGKKFYDRYDRRHDISIVTVFKLKENITVSGSWVFGTGNPITLPVAQFDAAHHIFANQLDERLIIMDRTEYGERNSFRMANYHRLDLGIQFKKQKKWGERTWEISFYNAYNRKNAFYYFIDRKYDSQQTKLKQKTLFPFIPSLAYNFEF